MLKVADEMKTAKNHAGGLHKEENNGKRINNLKKAQSKASGPESHGAAMLSDAKANDFNKAVKNLVDYLKNEKFKVLLVVAFAIIGTVLSILGPKIFGWRDK